MSRIATTWPLNVVQLPRAAAGLLPHPLEEHRCGVGGGAHHPLAVGIVQVTLWRRAIGHARQRVVGVPAIRPGTAGLHVAVAVVAVAGAAGRHRCVCFIQRAGRATHALRAVAVRAHVRAAGQVADRVVGISLVVGRSGGHWRSGWCVQLNRHIRRGQRGGKGASGHESERI